MNRPGKTILRRTSSVSPALTPPLCLSAFSESVFTFSWRLPSFQGLPQQEPRPRPPFLSPFFAPPFASKRALSKLKSGDDQSFKRRQTSPRCLPPFLRPDSRVGFDPTVIGSSLSSGHRIFAPLTPPNRPLSFHPNYYGAWPASNLNPCFPSP